MKLEIFQQIFETFMLWNVIKIHLVLAKLFHAYWRKDRPTDRRTGMTKLIVALRNSANVPKKIKIFIYNCNY